MNPSINVQLVGTRARSASLRELFAALTALAHQGLGRVLAVSQRVLCNEKRLAMHTEFLERLAMNQALPGPNVCNLALTLGDQFFGGRCAFTALAGLMTVPVAAVLILALAMHGLRTCRPRLGRCM